MTPTAQSNQIQKMNAKKQVLLRYAYKKYRALHAQPTIIFDSSEKKSQKVITVKQEKTSSVRQFFSYLKQQLLKHPFVKQIKKSAKKWTKKLEKKKVILALVWLSKKLIAVARWILQVLSRGVEWLSTTWPVQLVWYIGYSIVQTPLRHPFWMFTILLVCSSVFMSIHWVHDFVFKDLPDPQLLRIQQPRQTIHILDKNGVVLYRVYEDENRTVIPLNTIPKHVQLATIAIEDKEFYQHQGFSIRGIVRAAWANWEGESTQGGSTITQQLVKNRLLSSEKTLQRKTRELVLSVMVEQNFSKEEILEMYLNTVAYGGSTYGIEAASQRYFGKPATKLSLAEGALLAGLPQAPSTYTPFGPSPEKAKARQEEVLRRMVEDGYITAQQAEQAAEQQLTFNSDRIDIKAPHFVMYVRQVLAEKYGEELLEQGGLEVTTTLDYALHQQAEQLVASEVAQLRKLRISNGAALITNPKTGEVLSMVGSANYFDFEHDGQVNVTLRPRQPGSSIKPLTYALAFEKGKRPGTTILDEPITYQLVGSPAYSPKNYDGKFHGNVTLRESLGSSYNIPAVKLLAELGVNNMITRAKDLGIDTWDDPNRFGLSLTLGGGEVHMTDMAELYGVFANNGQRTDLNPILKITKQDGTVLYENPCVYKTAEPCLQKQVLDRYVAYLITHVLSDNQARTPAFGPFSTLTIKGQDVAVKTGTTNNLRDNWTIGYTTNHVVAVWVGNNDNTPMSYVASGVTGASPIWNSLIKLTLSPENPHTFKRPDGLIEVKICATTGTLPCKYCPRVTTELYAPGTEPTTQCNIKPPPPKPTPTPDPNNPGQLLPPVETTN